MPIIAATAAITLLLGIFATRVQIQSEIEALIPEDERVDQLIEKYGGDANQGSYLVLAVRREDPFEAEPLRAFADAIRLIDRLPSVTTVINPFDLVSFARNGKKLEIVLPPQTPPQSEEDIARFRQSLSNDPMASSLLLSRDRK